jgi:hypothetical protein
MVFCLHQQTLLLHITAGFPHKYVLPAIVSCPRPQIIPTVNAGSGDAEGEKRVASMLKHFRGLVDETAAKSRFLSAFHRKRKSSSSSVPFLHQDAAMLLPACGDRLPNGIVTPTLDSTHAELLITLQPPAGRQMAAAGQQRMQLPGQMSLLTANTLLPPLLLSPRCPAQAQRQAPL